VGPQKPLGKVGTVWLRHSSSGVKSAGLSPQLGGGGGGAQAASEGFCLLRSTSPQPQLWNEDLACS